MYQGYGDRIEGKGADGAALQDLSGKLRGTKSLEMIFASK
jgi:hypothetical protein